jgi:hypothetical protein
VVLLGLLRFLSFFSAMRAAAGFTAVTAARSTAVAATATGREMTKLLFLPLVFLMLVLCLQNELC